MDRPLRIEYPGAFYHITSRGNARRLIYYTNEDREYFLKLLSDVTKKYKFYIHVFTLMDNQARRLALYLIHKYTPVTGIFSLSLHSTADFNTHIPANALLLAIIMGLIYCICLAMNKHE